MTPADYAKKRRDRARAEGKCLQCCHRPIAPHSTSRCVDCLATRATYMVGFRDECRAARICVRCCKQPMTAGSDSLCSDCLEAQRAIDRNRRQVDWCDDCLAAGFHRGDCAASRKRSAA